MVISSELEGGANVVSEALRLGTPVIASRISGNIGMLGADYPGYYRLRDERALSAMLARFETDAAYRRLLVHACAARAKLVTPARESAALARVLSELTRVQIRTRKAA
jgi:glycosyltransferase involved in cell wall biosynthesis